MEKELKDLEAQISELEKAEKANAEARKKASDVDDLALELRDKAESDAKAVRSLAAEEFAAVHEDLFAQALALHELHRPTGEVGTPATEKLLVDGLNAINADNPFVIRAQEIKDSFALTGIARDLQVRSREAENHIKTLHNKAIRAEREARAQVLEDAEVAEYAALSQIKKDRAAAKADDGGDK